MTKRSSSTEPPMKPYAFHFGRYHSALSGTWINRQSPWLELGNKETEMTATVFSSNGAGQPITITHLERESKMTTRETPDTLAELLDVVGGPTYTYETAVGKLDRLIAKVNAIQVWWDRDRMERNRLLRLLEDAAQPGGLSQKAFDAWLPKAQKAISDVKTGWGH